MQERRKEEMQERRRKGSRRGEGKRDRKEER
jgi:hypothetical protein